MIGAPPPGGAPPGAAPKWTRPGEDPGDVWAMDYGKGRWIAPDEDKSSKRGHLAMPPGWSPRDLKEHPWSVVLSPPGTPPPPNTYTYTPSTREINAPGAAPSRDDRDALTLSFMPGGPPPGSPGAGTTTPPPGPAPGGQPGAGPPMPGRPGPGQPPSPGRPPGPPPPPPPGGPGMPPTGGPPPGGPPPGMPPPGMPPPPGPPGGSPPGMGGSPSPPMQPPGPLPPGGGMPPRPPAPPPGTPPPMGAPAGPGAGVSPGPTPSGPGAAPPPAPPNPGMAMGQVRPPPPASRPSPASDHQDPDSMVAALLRALGFEGEARSSPGEGQDRAPVGTGEDVPEDVTQARQRSVRAAADQWIGTPYGMGGSDQKAIDCSGLVNALLRGFGARIPAGHGPATTGWRNGQMATPIPWESIQPGDVLLSPANPRDPQNGEHMALYVGGGQMVEAAGPAGAPVRYSAVTNRNLQPYRMREPVPGLQQVTLMAQHEGGTPNGGQQGAQPGQPVPGPASVQRIAMDALNAHPLPANANAEIADIMAAGALFESGANPNGPAGDGGNSVGLWQINGAPNALGAGMTEAQRRDPATAAARIAPEYQRAYQQGQQRGFEGATLAAYTYINAERPANDPAHRDMRLATLTGPTAQAFQQKYQEVVAHSAQQQELQIGGGYAPPSGAAGQQNAGGSPNLVQQAQQNLQGILQAVGGAASAVGDRVASIGATPAYAEPSPPAASGPPGPTPQVQHPTEMSAAPPATPQPASQPPSPTGPGPQDVDAHGQPTGPVTTISPLPGSLAASRSAAQQPPAPSPPTVPAAAMNQTQTPSAPNPRFAPGAVAEGNWTPGQPSSPAPTGPQPPSNVIPGRHWDPTVVDLTTGQTVGDQVPEVPAYARNWTTPGQWVRVSERTPDMPANQPSTLQYRPTVSGTYDFGAGPVFYDAQANQAHQVPASAQRQQGGVVENYGNGLTVSRESATSPTGMATYVDPNGTILQATWTNGTFGDFHPAGGPSPGLSPGQQQQGAQYQQTFAAQQAQNAASNSMEQQRIDQQAQDSRDRTALGNRAFTDVTANTAAEIAARQAQQRLVNSVPVVGADNNLYAADPNNPDPNAPLVNMGSASPSPVQQAQIDASRAQTQRIGLENTAPIAVGNRSYRPTKNPDTGELSYGEGEPIPMSASEQALADERSREFGTLSAYQQSQADQSKASLEEQKSEFSQSLSEKQAESARPYQQMTKAEQAQDARAQQELGLKKEQLGFQENESANKLEQLPRGGLTRVNPYTGQIELVNAPEPEDIRMVGSQIYIPGGRQVSMLGQQISGGPNPYAGVPSGQGAPFRYPGGSGGSGQSFGVGGWGGGGMSGGQSGGGYQWQQPRQQQGWG